MQKLPAVASLVVAAVMAMSCSNTDSRVTATGPTLVSSQSPTLEIKPVVLQTSRFVSCPTSPPFSAVINVLVRAGDVRITVVEISAQFVDSSGSRLPQVTLPGPVPTAQFGSALIEARGTQTFPLTLGLGCGVGTRGTVTVIVFTRDDGGRMTTGKLSAVVG